MWMLTREVLRLRGELPRSENWKVLPDLFFYRDADDEQRIKSEMDGEFEMAPAGEQPAAAAGDAAEEQWNEEQADAWGT